MENNYLDLLTFYGNQHMLCTKRTIPEFIELTVKAGELGAEIMEQHRDLFNCIANCDECIERANKVINVKQNKEYYLRRAVTEYLQRVEDIVREKFEYLQAYAKNNGIALPEGVNKYNVVTIIRQLQSSEVDREMKQREEERLEAERKAEEAEKARKAEEDKKMEELNRENTEAMSVPETPTEAETPAKKTRKRKTPTEAEAPTE